MHAALVSAPAILGWGLLLAVIAAGLRPLRSPATPALPGWCWWLLIAGVLLAFRWPLIWLPHELYPDESQLLAGALTLRHDPMFWRSVDGGTAGPLDYYALLPAAFSPGVTGYAVARITVVVLVWGGLVAVGETLALITTRTIGRLAVLPWLAFEAFTQSPEFVHYSTERLPAFLLLLAVHALTRQGIRPTRSNLWFTALLLGSIPYAKLQAGPIAGGLGLLLLLQEFAAGRRGNLAPAVIAALLPTLATLAAVTVTAQGANMLIPYFLQNMVYAEGGRQAVGLVLAQLGEQAVTNGYLALWLAGSAVFFLLAPVRARNIPPPLRRYGLAAAGLLAVALLCILAPGRPYHHYLNLMTGPLSLLLGLALAMMLPPLPAGRTAGRMIPAGLFLLCGLAPQVGLRASNWRDPYEYYNLSQTEPRPDHHQLVRTIRAHAAPGEALGLWGWRSSLFVETGLRQATREAHTEFLFATGPWQQFYLRRYLEDLQAARPPVFVDAVGPGNFRFQDRSWGHEVFPRLKEWLAAHYTFLTDLDGTRVYVRNDRRPAGNRSFPPTSP